MARMLRQGSIQTVGRRGVVWLDRLDSAARINGYTKWLHRDVRWRDDDGAPHVCDSCQVPFEDGQPYYLKDRYPDDTRCMDCMFSLIDKQTYIGAPPSSLVVNPLEGSE